MTQPAGNKVVMIGIDAGDIGLIRSSLGQLSTLRELSERGALHELDSTANHMTSSVWPTFASGTMPGEHGVYYPMQWDPVAMQLRRVDADWVQFEPFWSDLAQHDVRATILDVPFSLPSRLQNGVEVLNWGSQEVLGPFHCNRRDIAREIKRRFGKHPMGQDIPVPQSRAKLEQLAAHLVTGARTKGELARWLMETTEWDLFVTVFGETHRGGHVLWPGDERVPPSALADVYVAIDNAIGHILDGVDSATTTVVVFSVHGMQPNYTQEHFVPTIMERVNARFRGERTPEAEPPASRRNPMRLLREALPPQLQATIARAVPAGVRDWVVRRAFCGGLDWKDTLGFALPGSGESYLRFNLGGREADGCAKPDSDAFRRYRDLLRDELCALRDAATDQPIVKELVFTADHYSGAHNDLLPDVVVLWNELAPATEVHSPGLGRMHAHLGTGRTGDHRPQGFAIVEGAPDGAPPLEHIVDFARFVRALTAPHTHAPAQG